MKKEYIAPLLNVEQLFVPDSMIARPSNDCVGYDDVSQNIRGGKYVGYSYVNGEGQLIYCHGWG